MEPGRTAAAGECAEGRNQPGRPAACRGGGVAQIRSVGPWLLSVKPGLTGLWQVLRHDELDYTRRISLDMHYIEHRSLRLDLEILLRTLPSVLARRGAY